MAVLTVEDLRVWFHTREGVVRAVDGISYSVEPGETIGIVGESGSGKSVSCYSLMGLIPMPPGRIESGKAVFGEHFELLHAPAAARRDVCGKRLTMIFQDPMTALNPYMRIGGQLTEPLRVHKLATGRQAQQRAARALEAVGIQDAEKSMRAYPFEFSGGMRQRVMIAMALITGPELLIADEPTTALDVTVQAQILRLIKDLQEHNPLNPERKMSMILITHDLAVVAGTCDRVLVMYGGRILESAYTRELYYKPRHPYTEALMRAVPSTRTGREDLYTIPGEPPDLSAPPPGCPFTPRCDRAEEKCRARMPDLVEISPHHSTACLRVQLGEI